MNWIYIVQSTAPLIIRDDSITLSWTKSEREDLQAMGGFAKRLTETLPLE
jgi:hypothetical protein